MSDPRFLGQQEAAPEEAVQEEAARDEEAREEEARQRQEFTPAETHGDAGFGTDRDTDREAGFGTDRDTDREAGLDADRDVPVQPETPVAAQATGNAGGQFFDGAVAEKLRDRWQSIQIDFVDDPRHAVEQAETLVEQVSNQLAEAVAARRGELRDRWSKDGGSAAHDDGVATEGLRTALQEYRSMFNQLLAL